MPNHDHNHEVVSQEWEKSQENEVIKGLKAGRPIAELIFGLPGFSEAFDHKLTCLDCSDGRVCSGAKMALAGQGLLLDESDRAILESRVKQLHLSVTAHEDCGAAALAQPGSDSDIFGYMKAKELAAKTANHFQEIHKDEFRCPVHNERILVLEGTGCFDAANFNGFPTPFISSASFFGLSEEYQKMEAKALINIALGDHGFGDRFDRENPFYLIVSAQNEEQLAKLTALAEEVAEDFGSRVKVDGFVAPAVAE